MKRGADLPDDHHVMRHVGKNRLHRDAEGNFMGLLPQAFSLRDGETSLSVNWIEHFEGEWDVKIQESVLLFRKIRDIKKSCAFAVGNVGQIKNISLQNNTSVRIAYAPTSSIPNHAEIHRLPKEDMALLESLAADAFTEIVFNKDYD